ncbi:MAG: nucleoside triphosphate pyrophosphatase [Anaerolineae bacterium]
MARQTLILASGSPRRREFMERLGLPFSIAVADVDERSLPGERPQELVARLSRAKAEVVAARHPGATVIGADTSVTLDGAHLGKPADPSEAAAMLACLRDRPHQVYSGVTVVTGRSAERRCSAVVESTVWMRAYSDAEIAGYVAGGSPLDKAGAYGIQDAAMNPVARLEGCYASVMGLPLCALTELLRACLPTEVLPLPDVPAICSAVIDESCCTGGRAVWTWER